MTQEDLELVEAAKEASRGSYSPYSHFAVGAALRLETGEIVKGSNQENAAYPVGCCAERTALFWTGANRPGIAIKAVAIAGGKDGQFTQEPVSPCGMCRQALLEAEQRQGKPIRVLLYNTEGVHIIEKVADLLPLSFVAETMNV